MRSMGTLPTFEEEEQLWGKGYELVIGVDEVGRGAFAGPVVAAAVAWPRPLKLKVKSEKLKVIEGLGINDSKRLKPNQREQLAKEIKKYYLAYGIGEVGVGIINRVGIGKATARAMRRAIQNLESRIKNYEEKKEFVLVDAFYIKYLRGIGLRNQKAIKKGDQKSISIAAASVLAKVYRDSLMQKFTKRYRKYRWGRNKGYGTKIHQEAIIKYGITSLHRRQFVETFLSSSAILKE